MRLPEPCSLRLERKEWKLKPPHRFLCSRTRATDALFQEWNQERQQTMKESTPGFLRTQGRWSGNILCGMPRQGRLDSPRKLSAVPKWHGKVATIFCASHSSMRPESDWGKLALQTPFGYFKEDIGNIWTSCLETQCTSTSYAVFFNNFGACLTIRKTFYIAAQDTQSVDKTIFVMLAYVFFIILFFHLKACNVIYQVDARDCNLQFEKHPLGCASECYILALSKSNPTPPMGHIQRGWRPPN